MKDEASSLVDNPHRINHLEVISKVNRGANGN